MSQKKQEANLISWKLIIDNKNQLTTELSYLPEKDIINVFKKGDRQNLISALRIVKGRVENLHNEIENHLNSLL